MGGASSQSISVPDETLTTKQAAQFLHLSPTTLETWRSRKEAPRFVRVGRRRVLYLKTDLPAFLHKSVALVRDMRGALAMRDILTGWSRAVRRHKDS